MKGKFAVYGLIIAVLVLGGLQSALAGTWTPATNLPIAVAGYSVQCADDPGSFYVLGGVRNTGTTSNRVFRYDIAAARWERLENMPKAGRGIGLACYEGKIYVAGGLVTMTITKGFYIYDIASDTWSKGANLPDYVWGAALGAWNGKLYLVGGSRWGGAPYTPESRVDVYSIASGKWTAGGGAEMPFAASFPASTQVGATLYVVGGASGDLDQNVNQTQRYDMSQDTWEIGPEFSSARMLGGLAATDSHLYMLGGDLNGGDAFNPTNLVDVLDLSAWPEGAWVAGTPLPANNLAPATACSEILTGGEIWDAGGMDVTPLWVQTEAVYYLPVGEGCP